MRQRRGHSHTMVMWLCLVGCLRCLRCLRGFGVGFFRCLFVSQFLLVSLSLLASLLLLMSLSPLISPSQPISPPPPLANSPRKSGESRYSVRIEEFHSVDKGKKKKKTGTERKHYTDLGINIIATLF